MKKLIFISLVLLLAGMIPAEAQVNMTLRGAAALPGKTLRDKGYPAIGASFGMGAHYSLINNKSFRLDLGGIFDLMQCGSKTFSFGNDRDRYYNTNITFNFNSRLIYNPAKIKPYISLGYGFLESSTNEEFYTVKNSSNSTTNNLSVQSTWNSSIGVGLLFEITHGVNFDFSITRYLGGKNTFIDFSTVTSDNSYVYVYPKTVAMYDMYLVHLGFVVDLERSNSSNSTSFGSNSTKSSSGSFKLNGRSKNTGSSHRFNGPRR